MRALEAERPKSATPTKSNVHMQHGWWAAFAKRFKNRLMWILILESSHI